MTSDTGAQIIDKAKEMGASMAGIANVEVLKKSPSHEITYHPHSGWFDEAPSKGALSQGKPLKGLILSFILRTHLLFIRAVLLSDVFPYHLFIQAYCAHTVTSRPKAQSCHSFGS